MPELEAMRSSRVAPNKNRRFALRGRTPKPLRGFAAAAVNVIWRASGYNYGYTRDMKTAISIPDEVFEAADRTAKKLGVSRSELYATAVQEFIERHRIEDVTSKLNEVFASTKSDLDDQLSKMQSRILAKEDW